jgi:homeobox-leucine zipper protein
MCRTKLKQKELECENLKQCCESLREENRRLEIEVQALRAMKIVQKEDLYAQSPNSLPLAAADLTMCPSCERLATKTTAATIS